MKTKTQLSRLAGREAYIRNALSLLAKKKKEATDSEKNQTIERQIRYLRNGVIPDLTAFDVGSFETYPETAIPTQEDERQLLVHTFDNWFALHPEKVAGTVKLNTSISFPVSIKGNRETVSQTFDQFLSPTDEPIMTSTATSAESNQDQITRLAKKSRKETQEKTLSFQQVVERYNQGLSQEEIQAWVWYKRSLGVPMTGWEPYYLPTEGGEEGSFLVTTEKTTIYDNHFRPLYQVKKGTRLGKPKQKQHDGGGQGRFYIFRDDEGIKLVSTDLAKDIGNDIHVSPKALDQLVTKGALFYREGELLPRPIFTYGNIYDAERSLRKDEDHIREKYGDACFELHSNAVQEAKPKSLSVFHPDPKERPIILAISQFANTFLIEGLNEDLGTIFETPVSLRDAFKEWLGTLDQQEIDGATAKEVWEHHILGKRIASQKLDKAERDQLRQIVRNEGERLFARFLHEGLSVEDQQRLDLDWNSKYNGQASLQYNRIPIGFTVSSKFKGMQLDIRPPQREGVAFMQMAGSGIIAYDVGVGKTMTAIINLANEIQNGQCERPLIVVPNPTYKKWIGELIGYEKNGVFVEGVLSNTGITINDWYNLNSRIRKGIHIDRQVPAKSITIVTYEGFKRIGFGHEEMEVMFEELVEVLSGGGQEDLRKSTVENSKFREAIGIGIKDTFLDIDKAGFDYLVIDEAHRCKNIFQMVREQDGKRRFNTQGAVSETGLKAFFLCNYIQRRYQRNVMLLTATPFTNSPLEIYSMLSLVALNAMRQQGLIGIRNFFELFVHEEQELAVNHKEELVEKTIIKRFNNRLLLQRLIHNHISYKTGEEAGVKRPCLVTLPRINVKKEGKVERLPPKEQTLTYLRMTNMQREYQNAITAMAMQAGPQDMGTIFRAMSMSLDNALSPYLVAKESDWPEHPQELVENSPKLQYALHCIKSVKAYHEERQEAISGQILYLNRGKVLFAMIKEWLIEEAGYQTGIKYQGKTVDEVEMITGGMSSARKELIKEAFNDGVIHVIIGTATIREGIDLQVRGTVIHNCYLDWNPTDIKQLEGRIYRQGNQFAFVRHNIPLVQDSMDVFIFQKLEEKTARINDIWYRGDRGNVIELDNLDPQEVKLALLTDVRAIAEVIQKEEVLKAERKIGSLEHRLNVLGKMASLEYVADIERRGLIRILSDVEDREKYNSDGKLRKAFVAIDAFVFGEKTDENLQKLIKQIKRFSGYYILDILARYKRYFKTRAALRKALKNVPEGVTLEQERTNLKGAITEARDHLEFSKSVRRLEQLFREADRKKSALQVDGKTVMERVEDFADLNYLLAFKFGYQGTACGLPSHEDIPGTYQDAQEVEDKTPKPSKKQEDLVVKLKMLALAAEAELNLLSLAA